MTRSAFVSPKVSPDQAHSQLDGLRTRLRAALEGAGNAVLQRGPSSLSPAVEAERKEMRTRHGHLQSYYQDKSGHGRPLVLIHSINAAASAYEMKPLFERFRKERPVYAVDLVGFGLSDREGRAYTPDLYVNDLSELLTRVKDAHEAADVVALSLSGEFVALVAARRPDLVHSLAIISPTGLQARTRGRRPSKARRPSVTEPLWGPLVFGVIASRPSLRYFLRRTFEGRIDEGLAGYDYRSAHQAGAWHAPLAFLRGVLFTPDIYETYARLTRPALILYDKDGFVTFDRLDDLLRQSSVWRKHRIAGTRGMPQFEKLDETVRALEEFWREHAHRGHA